MNGCAILGDDPSLENGCILLNYVLSSQYSYHFRQLWGLMGMMEILEQVSAVSEQMVYHGVTKEELLLLQATILVNAGK